MGFFDGVPAGLDRPGPGTSWRPPADELPRVATSALLLARTETVAVAITASQPDAQSLHVGVQFADGSCWVWPLPPPGPLVFACEWAAFGIPEARASTDAQPILDAAQHSVRLWPSAQ
jgi:hypothetical protein